MNGLHLAANIQHKGRAMFRWGILSTARIGINQVIPAICASSNGVVHAIASRDLKRARDVATRFGAPMAFGSYEELLACDEIDGVYIPVATSQHTQWTLKAAQAGKHVLCEKPIALKAADIDLLIEARDRHHVVISEAFMVYYHPQWKQIRHWIEDGAIGNLRRVEGAFSFYNIDPTNTRNQLALGGGALPDIGVYPVVTTRMATLQEPHNIHAKVIFSPDFKTDIYASVLAEFDGFDLSFYVSTQMALRQNMLFHGDEGFIEVQAPFNANKYDHAKITLHNRHHTASESLTYQNINQYQLQAEHFVRAAQGEDIAIYSLENSKANQHIIDRIYGAARTEKSG